jgi:alkylation response protein AidB-like acyl-CoA dehydrogenase
VSSYDDPNGGPWPFSPPSTIGPVWRLDDLDAFRLELDFWLDEQWRPDTTVRAWWRALADTGLTIPTWPRAAGGLSAISSVQQVIEHGLAARAAIAPPYGGAGIGLVAPTIRDHGSRSQVDRLVPPIVRGETSWCLLLGEHEESDYLANVATVAVPSPEGWTVSGTKVSRDAVLATRGLLLARSQEHTTGRRGLTCFEISMAQPGVEVEMHPDGSHTVRLDDVLVHHGDVVGQPGNGWQVSRTTLAYVERSLAGRIRRGLVSLPPGERAGYLDLTVADAVDRHRQALAVQAGGAPTVDRRRR